MIWIQNIHPSELELLEELMKVMLHQTNFEALLTRSLLAPVNVFSSNGTRSQVLDVIH